jgi:hypothetical protein
MTYASSRYALLLLALIIASAAAMTSLYQNPRRTDTCRDPEQLLAVSDLELEDYVVWLGDTEETQEDTKRNPRVDGYLKPTQLLNLPLPFTIRRTFMIPNWLVRPPSALPGPAQPDTFKTVVVDIDGTQVPIQFAHAYRRGIQSFVAYTMAYEGQPITSPFWVRTREAPMSLIDGVRPITYIGVAGSMGPIDIARHEQNAIDFVTAGWRHYRNACVQ